MEPLKRFDIPARVLCKRINATWDISCQTRKKQWKTKITVHGVLVDRTNNHLGAYFSQFGSVEDVMSILSKSSIAAGDFELHVTVTRKGFIDIPDTLLCRGKQIYVIV